MSKNTSTFSLSMKQLLNIVSSEFYWSCLVKKTSKLLNTNSNTQKVQKLMPAAAKVNPHKEMVAFMRDVDYCRLRNYKIKILFQHELISTSFFLVKDGFPQKLDKGELASKIMKSVECTTKVVQSDET